MNGRRRQLGELVLRGVDQRRAKSAGQSAGV